MIQNGDHNDDKDSTQSSFRTSPSSNLVPPHPPQPSTSSTTTPTIATTATTTTAPYAYALVDALNTFSIDSSTLSSSASATGRRIHYTRHQKEHQYLHRRRGSTASDHSSLSSSPSSPNPSRQNTDNTLTTFNPCHLSRHQQQQHQQQQRHQSSIAAGVGNGISDASHTLLSNIPHNNNRNSEYFFLDIIATPFTSLDNNNSNSLNEREVSQQQPFHPCCSQQYHPHAATADSMTSFDGIRNEGNAVLGRSKQGGRDTNGGRERKLDNNNAEVEVRVVANRTNVGNDNNRECIDQQQQLKDSALPSSVIPICIPPSERQELDRDWGTSKDFQPLSRRLQSLDILRGTTIIIMILVNTQGADPFEQLAHTPWFGYTLADWVFPNFIFMVGVANAIVFSPIKLATFSRRPEVQEDSSQGNTAAWKATRFWRRHKTRLLLTLKTIKRSTILFAIGLCLNALEMIGAPANSLWIRIPGVLQRIGFCYLVLALSVLWSPIRTRSKTLFSQPSFALGRHASFNRVDRAHKHSMTPSKFLTRRVQTYSLPTVCTALWFILTYSIHSTATDPIPDCLYPSQATTTNSTNGNIAILPGYAPLRGQLTPPLCTAQSVLDTLLFTKNRDLNNPIFDAEGSLGTLMAIVTAWFGWMMGAKVVEQQRQQKTMSKALIDEFEREVGEYALDKRNRNSIRDESPKDTSESSPFAFDQQPEQPQQEPHSSSTTFPLSPCDIPSSASSPYLSTTDQLHLLIASQQRQFLLIHLGEWFMIGICVMFSGTILGWFLPICKALWSPSFTLYSAGVSINSLCILMYLYDTPSYPCPSTTITITTITSSPLSNSTTSSSLLPPKSPTQRYCHHHHHLILYIKKLVPFLTSIICSTFTFITHLLICYGRNPTLTYILSELCKIVLEKIPAHGGYDWVQTVWSYLFFNSFYTFMPPAWASFVFSLVYILLFAPLLWYLNRKGVFLRV